MAFIQTSLLSSVIPVVTYSTISLQWGIWAQIALPPPTLPVSDLLWNHLGICLLQRFSYYYLRYLNWKVKLWFVFFSFAFTIGQKIVKGLANQHCFQPDIFLVNCFYCYPSCIHCVLGESFIPICIPFALLRSLFFKKSSSFFTSFEVNLYVH